MPCVFTAEEVLFRRKIFILDSPLAAPFHFRLPAESATCRSKAHRGPPPLQDPCLGDRGTRRWPRPLCPRPLLREDCFDLEFPGFSRCVEDRGREASLGEDGQGDDRGLDVQGPVPVNDFRLAWSVLQSARWPSSRNGTVGIPALLCVPGSRSISERLRSTWRPGPLCGRLCSRRKFPFGQNVSSLLRRASSTVAHVQISSRPWHPRGRNTSGRSRPRQWPWPLL
ncbi:uncharacterized protein AAES06_005868 [Glossophaga mutica]